jgi:hypothetical protein
MRNAHKILFEKSEGVGVEGRKSILRSGIWHRGRVSSGSG